MNKSELVMMLRSKVFGDRGTDIQAAFDYVESVINGMSESADRGPAWIAVHVLANTIANVIETLPEFLPAPPEVVRISPEDNPATGAPEREIERVTLVLDRESLNEIIDARIQNWADSVLEDTITEAINDYDFEETVRDIVRHNLHFSIDVE